LYDVLGSTWQTDSTHFKVPDFRDRVPVGTGAAGAGYTTRAMGDVFGAETVTLTTANMPAHTHDVSTNNAGSGGPNGVTGTTNTSNTQTATAKALTNGSGTAHSNIQPSLAVGFAIVFE
jgi:microcystin-dependent protein